MTALPINSRSTHASKQARADRQSLSVIFAYFVVAGVATVMLGPTLPLLAERWSLPDAQLGTLFFAYFAGQLCGAWFATRRLGVSLLLGASASALGFFALAFAGPASAHLLLYLIGLGIGAGLTSGNVVVGTIDDPTAGDPTTGRTAARDAAGEDPAADSSAESRNDAKTKWSRSRLLTLLNMSWGLGAIACPLWLRGSVWLGHVAGSPASSAGNSSAIFFLGLGVAFAATAGLIGGLLPYRLYRRSETIGGKPTVDWRTLWVFVPTMALYVGVENALAGWLPTYAQRLAAGGVLSRRAAEVALCFWVAELAGRALTAVIVKTVDERALYRASLITLIATIGALVMTPHLGETWIFGLTALAAVCLAPLFPLAVSFMLARAGKNPRLGRVFASSSLGGTVLPWLTGIGSSYFQSLRLSFIVPAAGAALILLLSWYLPGAEGDLRAAER